MGNLFSLLGKKAGETYKKSKWIYDGVLGDKADAAKSERAIGREIARQMLEELPPIENEAVIERIRSQGHAMAERITNENLRFEFFVVRAQEANAFALPGGYIFLTDKVVELSRGDAHEIAFILGHEMGHVEKGHAFNRILTQYSVSALANLFRTAGLLQSFAKKMAAKYLLSNYSRDNEFEADDFAVRLMKADGYEAAAAGRALAKLDALSDKNNTPLKYFSSHPSAEDRINNIRHYFG